MGIICLICMLTCGMDLPMSTQIVMGTEITNVILIIRDRLGKNSTSIAALINSVCLFVFYTLLRVLMMPIVWTQMCYRLFTAPEKVFPYAISVILFALIIGLNFFWYSLILKGAVNLIKGEKKFSVDIDLEKEKGRDHQDDLEPQE